MKPIGCFSLLSTNALVLCLTAATWAAPFDPSTLRLAQGRPEQRRGTTSSGSPRTTSRGDSRALAQGTPAQPTTVDLERAVGQWHSTERFEEESRITVAFRRQGAALQGWAVLLGQKRKADNRATLALAFCDAAWDGQRFVFNTIFPEDEDTIGWELRVTTPTTAVLRALTENGEPIPDELRWDMTR